MIKKVLSATLVMLITSVFSTAAYAYSENIVASLDDQKITVEILTTYVEDVAGDNYKPWLSEKVGLRKLADFFINRTLLLKYAKQNVDKKDTIVTNHGARSVNANVMLLSALLQTEVQNKVNISDEDVRAYMTEKKTTSEKLARQEMESDQKIELMAALVEKVRSGHEIKYFN